ncbi:alpha/beta fold hydrolase [Rubripirellula obstinata]|nr:alpha/beta fold hydrolase [Rubripirellula obstinata]
MKTKLLLISGWAFGNDALFSLARELEAEFEVDQLAAEDILSPGQLNQMLPANQPCVLVGWSLGGMLALEAATNLTPGSMLVLIGSTGKFCSGKSIEDKEIPHGVPPAQLRSLSISLRRQPEQTVANFYKQSALPHAVIDQPANVGNDNKKLNEGLNYLGDRDLRSVAADLQVPTLVLHGTEDQVIPIAASEDLSRLLCRSKFLVFDQVGHDLPIREPVWVANHILDFWNTQSTGDDAR